jgi:hypothetical protein
MPVPLLAVQAVPDLHLQPLRVQGLFEKVEGGARAHHSISELEIYSLLLLGT